MCKNHLIYSCRPQIKVFIEGLFSFDQDIPSFKEHLRDFLVQIRVCTLLMNVRYCMEMKFYRK